ncbi:MAG: YggU family protein [Candidatus Heimdallarchaeota archaeon]|nr:MAG: YggU family protein [Candidatus Heimdallarchaeota archaeon]
MQRFNWLKVDDEDTLVTVNVKTLRNEDQFIIDSGKLIVTVKEPPIKGKANKKLLKIFRKKFRTEVTLESGQLSSTKVFRLRNTSSKQILEILGE